MVHRPMYERFSLSRKPESRTLIQSKALNEKLHILNRDNKIYQQKIYNAISTIIHNIKNDITERYMFKNRRYTKVVIKNLLPEIDECVIYAGVNTGYMLDNVEAILLDHPDIEDCKKFV